MCGRYMDSSTLKCLTKSGLTLNNLVLVMRQIKKCVHEYSEVYFILFQLYKSVQNISAMRVAWTRLAPVASNVTVKRRVNVSQIPKGSFCPLTLDGRV